MLQRNLLRQFLKATRENLALLLIPTSLERKNTLEALREF